MRKTRIFSALLLVLLSVVTFTGCLFSDSATMKKCYSLYDSNISSIVSNNSDEVSKEVLTVKIDNTDIESNNNSTVNYILFTFTGSLKEDLEMSSTYKVLLENEGLVEMMKYSLVPFCYYQEYLKISSIDDSIDKSYKKSLYEAIEKYNDLVNECIKKKKNLEQSYVKGNIDKSQFAKQKLDALVDLYIDIIKQSNLISEISVNAVNNFNPLSDSKDMARDARYAVNSTLNYDIKLLINYYEQYIEYYGISRFSEMSSNFSTLRSNINSLFLKIKDNMVLSDVDKNFSKENTKQLIENLDKLKLTASQCESLNDKLDGTIYSLDIKSDNYNFEQATMKNTYDNILSREEISSCNQYALNI